MRYLIDGYNVMYAGGLLDGKRLGSAGFRRARTRFLNRLADALGPVDAHQTTVVFDAAAAPEGFANETRHKGLSVVYAVDDENADARIERLIAAHATPRTLAVVSSDNRIRQAATRRKALAVTAEDFWVELDARKERGSRPADAPPSPVELEPSRDQKLSPEESAFWAHEFRELDRQTATREALGAVQPPLNDAEIAEIEREIERESE
jgi:uncharacterized protein